MELNILISILIPCYNSEIFLNKTLKSCQEQTYDKIEIIAIDDGSKDDTFSILKEFSQKDSRIKIFQQKNKGISFTRNKLISLARGEYICFLDSDDFLHKDSLYNLINNSSNGNMDIVIGRTEIVFSLNSKKDINLPFIATWNFKKNMNQKQFVKSNMCLLWGSIFKRDFLNSLNIEFDNKLKYFEDLAVSAFIFLKSKKFKQIKDVTYFYSRRYKNKDNLSSFSSDEINKLNDFYFSLRNLLDLFKQEKWVIDKDYDKSINGSFFPIFFSYNLLVESLTKNIILRWILRKKIIDLINRYGYKIKFSKTLWKTFIYFYIIHNFSDYVKNNNFRKIGYLEKKNDKTLYNGLTQVTGLVKFFNSKKNMKKNILIIDYKFIKKNYENISLEDDIFFLIKISSNDDIEDIFSFVKKNKINPIGYSIKIGTDLKKIMDYSYNILLLNIYFDDFSKEKINDYYEIKKNLKENVEIAITINKGDLNDLSSLSIEYQYIFIK